jgi:DNA-binding beta-propeller fold protein YncE
VLRALTVAALACALGASGAAARTAGGTAAAFVTLERPSQLVGVDLTTGRVVARIRVPAGPGDVVSYGARHLLVVSPDRHAVTLVDSFEERVLKVWRGFGRPVAVATNGAYAYVADAGRSELAIIDLATRRIRGRVAIRPAPRDVAVGDTALLTHADASGNLTVAELSWSHDRVLRFRHIPAGGPAEDISHQADSAYAYVTYSDSGVVGALDWGTESLRWKRRVGADVAAIAVDHYHGRRLWIADREAGAILALSTESGRVLRRMTGCPGASGVTVVGSVWVAAACGEAEALAFWSQRNRTRKLVHVGGRPHGVAEVVLP